MNKEMDKEMDKECDKDKLSIVRSYVVGSYSWYLIN